jgi:Family of unknown function (DUF6283)
MSTDLLPCATCPWRTGKDATTIPRYSHAKACGLVGTVGRDDDFRQIMACHHSTGAESEAEQACKGYLAQAGESNLNVRMLAMSGLLPWPRQVAEACFKAGVELEPDYETVLDKLAASLVTA